MNHILKSIVALLAVSQVGFAMPGADLAQKALIQRLNAAPRHNGQPAACVNFAGNWKGRCTVGDVTEESSVEIKQTGCAAIQMAGTVINVGALETHSTALPVGDKANVAVGGGYTHDWSADGSQLNTIYAGAVKVLGVREPVALNGKGMTKLDGGKLVSELSLLDMKISCSFDKQ